MQPTDCKEFDLNIATVPMIINYRWKCVTEAKRMVEIALNECRALKQNEQLRVNELFSQADDATAELGRQRALSSADGVLHPTSEPTYGQASF